MSADNGIYIALFPNGEYRVAHAFDSVINELETHWYSPEDSRDAIMSIFDGPVFTDEKSAYEEAYRLQKHYEWTEYGICFIQFTANYGELRGEVPVPPLSPNACVHCSTPGGTEVWHGDNDDSCRNPALPRNILVKALRERTVGINEHVVVRRVLEALEENGLEIVAKENHYGHN